MSGERSELEKRLIREGLKPAAAPAADIELRELFFAAALDVLKRGAPGLTEISCTALARSISLRCERAAEKRERGA